MNCEDLDRLRTNSGGCAPEAWPAEARRHFSSCERCRQLQAVLQDSGEAEMVISEALNKRIEAVILSDLNPVSPLPSVIRTTITLVLLAVAVVAAITWRLGQAGWHVHSRLEAFVMFGSLGLSVLLLANLLSHQMAPGAKRRLSPAVSIAAPLMFLLFATVALFSHERNPAFVAIGLRCWIAGVVSAMVSAPLLWFALRRGFTVSPGWHGATAGLLAGLIGVAVLAIDCPRLDRLHISTWHIGAAVGAMLTGAAIGGLRRHMHWRGRRIVS